MLISTLAVSRGCHGTDPSPEFVSRSLDPSSRKPHTAATACPRPGLQPSRCASPTAQHPRGHPPLWCPSSLSVLVHKTGMKTIPKVALLCELKDRPRRFRCRHVTCVQSRSFCGSVAYRGRCCVQGRCSAGHWEVPEDHGRCPRLASVSLLPKSSAFVSWGRYDNQPQRAAETAEVSTPRERWTLGGTPRCWPHPFLQKLWEEPVPPRPHQAGGQGPMCPKQEASGRIS